MHKKCKNFENFNLNLESMDGTRYLCKNISDHPSTHGSMIKTVETKKTVKIEA